MDGPAGAARVLTRERACPPSAASNPAHGVRTPRHLLPVLVLAQLLGVSPWFAVNAVMGDLQRAQAFSPQALGTLSAGIQLGFIAGTLVFALTALADRFAARRVFVLSALAAAACTLAAMARAHEFHELLAWRIATGVCLAGIYPVGMKLASLWFPQGLGAALGWLVGALVLGSASPHLLRALDASWPWQGVFVAVAAACVLAALLVWRLVPEPPPRPAAALRLSALASLWTERRVRASVLGYFGHMWELYTVWVLLPLILATRLAEPAQVSGWAFVTLGVGALGCVAGGLVAHRRGAEGSARVAVAQLATSGACCLAAPWMLQAPLPVFLAWLVLWGITVAGDSPQFSALTARNAPPASVGSVLTFTNCIGFALSAASIELFVRLAQQLPLAQLLPWLALGPALGLLAMRPLLRGATA